MEGRALSRPLTPVSRMPMEGFAPSKPQVSWIHHRVVSARTEPRPPMRTARTEARPPGVISLKWRVVLRHDR